MALTNFIKQQGKNLLFFLGNGVHIIMQRIMTNGFMMLKKRKQWMYFGMKNPCFINFSEN